MCFQLIEGNKNAYASVINDLHPPVITRYVRLIPVTVLSTTVCMRVELYGCPWEGRNAQTHRARRVLWLSSLLISAFISSPKCLLRLERRVNSSETRLVPKRQHGNQTGSGQSFVISCAIKTESPSAIGANRGRIKPNSRLSVMLINKLVVWLSVNKANIIMYPGNGCVVAESQ